MELKLVRLKVPGRKAIRICIPVLLDNSLGFYCLGLLGSFSATSEFASVKSALGKWITLKYLERLKSRKEKGSKPDTVLYCSNIKTIHLKTHRLLGLESLELKIIDLLGREYIIGQADTLKEFKETILAIKDHLNSVCRIRE